jgi:cysteinyl-tRNA synthetase
MVAEMHALRGRAGHKSLAGTLRFLGVRPAAYAAWKEQHAPKPEISEVEIERLVSSRLAARKAKNFAESDRIRDELAAMGVVLKDTKEGTTWEIAR